MAAATTTMARPVVGRRVEDRFFVSMAVAILFTVVLGFGPTYFYRGAVFAKLPSPLVHLHGALFSSWVILYLVQTVLVATRNVRLHRGVGRFGGFLPALMVPVGIAATIALVRRGGTPPQFTPPMFLVLNCWGVTLFGLMVGWAILKRNDRLAHKRIMLLATIGIMPPAINRIQLLFHLPEFAIPLWMLALAVPVLVYDLWTRRKPHYATVVAFLLIFSVQPTAVALGHTPPLERAAAWLLAHR